MGITIAHAKVNHNHIHKLSYEILLNLIEFHLIVNKLHAKNLNLQFYNFLNNLYTKPNLSIFLLYFNINVIIPNSLTANLNTAAVYGERIVGRQR